METLNHQWKLPTEIVQMIFENIEHQRNYTKYQLVSKQWYNASLPVVYKTIVVDGNKESRVSKLKRVENTCNLLCKSLYSIGQYVKVVIFHSIDCHLLSFIINQCYNVEELRHKRTKEIVDYLTNIKAPLLWNTLRHLVDLTKQFDSNYSHLVYMFHHRLVKLYLTSLPKMYGDEGEWSRMEREQITEEDIYEYIDKFKI